MNEYIITHERFDPTTGATVEVLAKEGPVFAPSARAAVEQFRAPPVRLCERLRAAEVVR